MNTILNIAGIDILLDVDKAMAIYKLLSESGKIYNMYSSSDILKPFDEDSLSLKPADKDIEDDCIAAQALGVKIYEYRRDKRAY